jgi:K+-transporting ATPase KdpF subunit
MTLAVFGWAISGDDFLGIIVAILIAAYLVYALVRPEKL